MNVYGFEVAHGYKIMKCYAKASGRDEIISSVKNNSFEELEGYDCIGEYGIDDFVEGYELIDIWG